MAMSWIVVFVLFTALPVHASNLDDFSNNLATDIGPLLALFGENVTKQYISESTSFLDYFIFAMAPMGIVTAITSVIRVCGDSSLRAFIGRAQEGDGAVEAELCTSTSRDVCELFHKGGITRVFGKPRILEVIHLQEVSGGEKEIYLFREHLRNLRKDGEWTAESIIPSLRTNLQQWLFSGRPPRGDDPEGRVEPKKEDESESQSSSSELLVQNPNLSLNVGIEKLPDWAFYVVAVVGFILQAGVMAMAAVITWWFEWSQSGPPNSLVGIQAAFLMNRSPLSFLLGTFMLCSGMFCCAALIGESTEEQYYRRKKDWNPQIHSKLFWLQPGGQEVGGETFDAFAYFENAGEKLVEEYITSTKKKVENFRLYTWVVVVVTIGGYVAQFIGLRGMNASVSISQLGITLLMSFLRGCLRMRRLSQDDNKLASMPDMVLGHELDWLTFKLASENLREPLQTKDEQCLWLVTNQHTLQKHGGHTAPNQHENLGERLLQYRTRLAHLTGHEPLNSQKEPESVQSWNSEHINVRSAAKNVAQAISAAAEAVLGPVDNSTSLELEISIGVLPSERSSCSWGPIKVTLQSPKETSTGKWVVDSAKLEGILGLWLWSLKKPQNFQEDDEHGNKCSTAEKLPMARIVSYLPSGDSGISLEAMQGELDLWLGQNVVKLQRGTLQWPHDTPVYDSLTTWKLDENEIWKPDDWANRRKQQQWMRFFGRQVVSSSSRHTTEREGSLEMKRFILYAPSQNSLLSECSHELYSALVTSIIRAPKNSAFGEVTITQASGQIRLEHPKVAAMITAFTDNSLGSRSDAVLCIIPRIREYLRSPKADDIFSSLMRTASQAIDGRNENVAESLLQWIYHHSLEQPEGSQDRITQWNNFASGLIAMAEFYRPALVSRRVDERMHGYNRIKQLIERYNPAREQENGLIGEILDRYRDVALQIAKEHEETTNVQEWTVPHWTDVPDDVQIVSMIQDNRRTESIYLLCKVTPDLLRSKLEAALPTAAKQKWTEVITALLDLGALLDGQDGEGRTALSYCAEHRNTAMVNMLLELGASPDLPDQNKRTPLWWAAQQGHREVIKLLRNTGKVSVDSIDNSESSPFSQAARYGHKDVVRMLRDTALVSLDRRDLHGRTPFSYVAGEGRMSVIDEFISDNRINKDDQDNDGRTPLSWAVGNGEFEVVKALVKNTNANVNLEDTEKRTPLFWAVQIQNLEILKLLLSSPEIRVNERDIYGQTALVRASQSGSAVIINELLSKKDIEVNIPDEMGRTALWWALRNGHQKTAELLLAKDNAHSDLKDAAGRTPLWWAVRTSNGPLATWLLELRVDAGSSDSAGHSPLWWAARNGDDDLVQLLLKINHINPDIPGGMGQTPLSWAARRGNTTIVQMLLDTGKVCPDSRDDNGRTPLSWAAGEGHTDIARVLISSSQVIIDARDFAGRTPQEWAEQNGHKAIIKLLTK